MQNLVAKMSMTSMTNRRSVANARSSGSNDSRSNSRGLGSEVLPFFARIAAGHGKPWPAARRKADWHVGTFSIVVILRTWSSERLMRASSLCSTFPACGKCFLEEEGRK
jgi:hypothetical protein